MLKRMGLIGGRPVFADTCSVTDLAETLWIDLHNPTPEEEDAVEAALGIPIPTRLEMAEIEESARLYLDGDAQVMTAVLIEGAARGRPNRSEVTFLLTPDHLVTVRYADPTPFRSFPARIAKLPDQHLTAPAVLVSLIESIVERAADIMEQAAGELNDVSDAIFYEDSAAPRTARKKTADPLRTVIHRLGQMNRTLSILRESLHSLGRMATFLRQWRSKIDEDGVGARLKAVERDVRSIAAFEAQLGQQISFLHEATLGLINIEQNAIIKVFSIAAVLFLPPTLVGTVYGMNFAAMPELQWAWGYPFALACMVVSATLPYLWFKWRGWL